MDTEYELLVANSTWIVTDLPKDQQVIGCKWTYTIKRDSSVAVWGPNDVPRNSFNFFISFHKDTFFSMCRYE